MSEYDKFAAERARRIADYATDERFRALSKLWLQESMQRKYVYNFEWLGRPIIQYPQDIIAVQELVWSVKPDLIIETGIAHGGSLILSASLLTLLDLCEPLKSGLARQVIGIDVEIRNHNRMAIENHPLSQRIFMVEGSSISTNVIREVQQRAAPFARPMVLLDSMHTDRHVSAELEAYCPLVSAGSYCLVFDTFVENMPRGFFSDRPWDVGNNPATAVARFLGSHPEFEHDSRMEQKLQITVAPGGFLKRLDVE